MKRSLKRNERPKAWIGAVAAIGSLISSGISAYQGYKSAKAQQEEIQRQRDIETANNLSQYYQNSQDLVEQNLVNSNMKYKCGGRRKLSRLGSHSSTGGRNYLPDSNGKRTNLFFNDGTQFITKLDRNNDVIIIPNAKTHDDPTPGEHGNIDIAKNGKTKPVLQEEKTEATRIKNGEIQVLSDTLIDPDNHNKTISQAVIDGDSTFDEGLYKNDIFLNNMKHNKGRLKLAKWGWSDKIGSSEATYGDAYTSGLSALSGLIQSGVSIATNNRLRRPQRPVLTPVRSLNTRENIAARLANIEENRQRTNETLRRNIASGHGFTEASTDVNQNALQQTNALNENKVNIERGLINDNTRFILDQNRYNNDLINKFNAEDVEFDNTLRANNAEAINRGITSVVNAANTFNTNLNNRITSRINAFSARLASNPQAFDQAIIDDPRGAEYTFGKEAVQEALDRIYSRKYSDIDNLSPQEIENYRNNIPSDWDQEKINWFNERYLYSKFGRRKSLKRL